MKNDIDSFVNRVTFCFGIHDGEHLLGLLDCAKFLRLSSCQYFLLKFSEFKQDPSINFLKLKSCKLSHANSQRCMSNDFSLHTLHFDQTQRSYIMLKMVKPCVKMLFKIHSHQKWSTKTNNQFWYTSLKYCVRFFYVSFVQILLRHVTRPKNCLWQISIFMFFCPNKLWKFHFFFELFQIVCFFVPALLSQAKLQFVSSFDLKTINYSYYASRDAFQMTWSNSC